MSKDFNQNSDFLFYNNGKSDVNIPIIIGDEDVWTTQRQIADIFGVDRSVITKHIQNLYETKELDENSTSAKIAQVQSEAGREVTRNIMFYNLDVILSVGYKVNSYQASLFRKWANNTLKEYLIKGFAMDDERLKQGKQIFGKDYFEELLQRIREIRVSERRFYQKVTDLYALSSDYDPKSPITKDFFATVQNKLEFAITGHTAAEIVKGRADSSLPNMGLQTWSKPNGKIILKDAMTAKNYLKEGEINELNRLVNSYLDYAELQASRNKIMTMSDWADKLDAFLKFNEYAVLDNAGKVSKVTAEKFAKSEYDKFRVKQDKEFKSDFDKIASNIIATRTLPKEEPPTEEKKSDFDEKLKQALNYNPKEDKNK